MTGFEESGIRRFEWVVLENLPFDVARGIAHEESGKMMVADV